MFTSLATNAQDMLTNQDVIAMNNANVGNSLMQIKISGSPATFDLSPRGLIELENGNVPDGIIKVMMAKTILKDLITNDDIVLLQRANVSKSVILERVRRGKNRFDTSARGLIALRSARVSDAIIRAIMSAPKPYL